MRSRAVALILTVFVAGLAAAAPAPEPTPPTEVIIYRPRLQAREMSKRSGYCWTESIAVNRPGAWRCMEGNSIHDPCFEAATRKQVICGADPVKHDDGFLLALTRPLPSPQSRRLKPQPWLIETADGSVCQVLTGTMAIINGEAMRYPCSVSPASGTQTRHEYCGLLNPLHPGKVWSAEKICFTVAASNGRQSFNVISRKSVTIRRLWE